jgi:hypothetical protein
LLVLFTAVFVSLNVSRHQQISPIDEYVYLDYTAQIFDIGVLPMGSQTGEVARNYISCLGVAGYGEFNPEACNSGDYTNDSAYPYEGQTSADLYPPMYFVVSAAVAHSLSYLFDVDFLDGARLSGALWLAAAAVMLYLTLRRLKIDTLTALAAPLIMASSLASWWSSTFVSTDVTALLAGAITLYALVRYLQRDGRAWFLIFISVFVTLLKFQNILAVAILATVVALQPIFSSDGVNRFGMRVTSWRRSLIVAASSLLAALFSQVIWVAIRQFMAVGNPTDQGISGLITPDALLSETVKFIAGMAWGASGPQNVAALPLVIATITTWLLIGGAVSASISDKRISFLGTLGFSWIAVSFVSAPLLGIAIYLSTGTSFSLPARYGLSLFPIGLALVAVGLGSNRIWRSLIRIFAVLAAVGSLFPVMSQ